MPDKHDVARESLAGDGHESAIFSNVLAKGVSAWDGTNYASYPAGKPELTVLRITIPANMELPWHLHPMPNVTHVISGSITLVHRASGKTRLIKAGDTLLEWMNEEHRGVTADQACEVINFYAGAQDLPLSISTPGAEPEMPDL
jgi:quercetin dioxygenase-like cupin family protein